MDEMIPSLVETSSVKNEDITYSSLLSGGNPIDNYLKAKEEIRQTGESSLVNEQVNSWKLEQLSSSQIENILADPTISPSSKRKIASNYVKGALPILDLREKYLLKQASQVFNDFPSDTQSQDNYANNVIKNDQETKQVEESKLISIGTEAILTNLNLLTGRGIDILGQAVVSGTSKIALSIPAGLTAALAWALGNGIEEANDILKKFQEYAYEPNELASQKILDSMQQLSEIIDIPFKWIGDKTLEITGSPGQATASYVGTQLVSGLIGGVAFEKTLTTSVPKMSPLNTANIASREAGTNIASTVMTDSSGVMEEALGANKTQILNDYFLPKIEFEGITGDARKILEEQDQLLNKLYDDTELHPHIAPVSEITHDRDLYLKVLNETAEPHLLLSSSVLGTTEKTFGRIGTGREAIIDTNYNKLEGIAVFGRNKYWGFPTEKKAQNYIKKLQDQTSHLPDPGTFSLLEKDGEFFVQWNFKKDYNYWERLAFGSNTLEAQLISPKYDISWFANTAIGDKIWPSYMRLRSDIPSVGATTAWKEGHVEGTFINAQRALILKTSHPKELVAMVRKGEKEGKVFSYNEYQTLNPHLKQKDLQQSYTEYVGFRRIQDHLYRFADRSYRRKLQNEGIKNLYDKDGNNLGLVSEPITDFSGIKKVWDIQSKSMIDLKDLPQGSRIVHMKEGVKHTVIDTSGEKTNHLLQYAVLNPEHQLGELRAGTLTKIPGYVARHYKEWFVLDKQPNSLYVNGEKVADTSSFREAVAMGKTKKEIQELQEQFQLEDPEYTYTWRKEEKRIEDVVMHDSHIYDTYLKEHHKRGEPLPSKFGEAEVEDILVAQTRAIQGVAKVTSWEQLDEVNRKHFVKAYGDFTEYKFPGDISDIKPKKKMNEVDERRFLAAQKVFQQWEMQQIQKLQSDILWKNILNHTADVLEKMDIPAPILREWGDKGMVPVRAMKALASNLYLYSRFIRMWFVQPQQWKELSFLSPSFAKSLDESAFIVAGLLARTNKLGQFKSFVDARGRQYVKDYDLTMNALETSGIKQAVDMNQMIHGIWRDSLNELDPKSKGVLLDTIYKGGEITSKTVALPFKMGRAIGYDPAELTNQITLWLFAKDKWIKENPEKIWHKPENVEQILQLQSRIGHMASTRAGMFSWQDGTAGLITQFAAIPYKSFLQMISAKDLTASDKGKLAAARLFWYGKYGIPGGAIVYKTLERNAPEESKENLEKMAGGMTDIIWNNVLTAMYNEEANVAASKSLATVSDSLWFYDLAETLYKMADGQPTDQKFPFLSAGSSIFTAVEKIHDLFSIVPETGQERDYNNITWAAIEWIKPLSDYSKSQLAENITSKGNSYGYVRTAGEQLAALAGVSPQREIELWEGLKDNTKREKYIKEDAKQIHERLIQLELTYKKDPSISNKEIQDRYFAGLKAFMNRVDPSYREEMITAILKQDRDRHITLKDSLIKYYYSNARIENDKYLQNTEKVLKNGDEEMQTLYRDITGKK